MSEEKDFKGIGYREEFEFAESDVCPWCGSENLEIVGGELAMADGEDIDVCQCHDCHREWRERSDGFIVEL